MKASPFLAAALNFTVFSSLLAQSPSQNPTQPKPSEEEVVRVTTNLVQVDAVVVDKNGKAVKDLRAEDFEVLEDGKPQKVTACSYISVVSKPTISSTATAAEAVKNAPPLPPNPLRPEQVRRTIVFAIDDIGLTMQSLQIVKSALKRFVEEEMQPGDLVALVRTRDGSGALQRFTTDKRQLYASIDSLHWQCPNRVGTSGLRPSPCAPFPGQYYGSLTHTLTSLTYILEGLRTLPGRKAMVLVTDSFETLPNPADLLIGVNVNKPEPGATPAVSLSRTGESSSTAEDPSKYLDLGRGLTQLSNQASVVIYGLDGRGLQPTNLTAEDNHDVAQTFSRGPLNDTIYGTLLTHRSDQMLATQQGLQELAHQTGGFAIINNNDLGKGITRITDDLNGYYLIGYRPDDSTFQKRNGRAAFHDITLKVKRPGISVRSRKGFYGVPDEKLAPATPKTKEAQMVAALESPFSAGDVRLRLTTLFGDIPQTSFVRTLLHIDTRDLTFKDQPDGWHQADFDVLASSYGENGLVADYLSRSETIRARGKTYANLLRYGLNYNLLVPIKKPGPYQLRAAVRDAATERIGSAYQFIEVPELKKGRLALSGIALSSAFLDLAALSSDSAVYNAPAGEGDQAQPTPAVRRFKSGMLLDYRYVVYNASSGAKNTLPDLQAQVRLFHDGELVTSQDEPPADTGRLQMDPKRLSAKGSLRLNGELIPGQYVLQIVVTDRRAKEKYATASQWIDFEIVK